MLRSLQDLAAWYLRIRSLLSGSASHIAMGRAGTSMGLHDPYYTIRPEPDGERNVYQDELECSAGRLIPAEHRRWGMDGRVLCDIYHRMKLPPPRG